MGVMQGNEIRSQSRHSAYTLVGVTSLFGLLQGGVYRCKTFPKKYSAPELARASELSHHYKRLSNDPYLWKLLCIKQSTWGSLSPLEIVSKTRAKKEFFLSEADLFDTGGEPLLRTKTYDNYFLPTVKSGLPDGSIVVPPIREFLKRDVEKIAYGKWGDQAGFEREKERRQLLRISRQRTVKQNEEKRATELHEALKKEGVSLNGVDGATSNNYVRKRLREQMDNYIKHGGQKRAKFTITDIVTEAKHEAMASQLLQALAKAGIYLNLNQTYTRIKAALFKFKQLPSIPKLVRWVRSEMRKQDTRREQRRREVEQSLQTEGLQLDEEDDIAARWGWSFKVVYDSYLEEEDEAEAFEKMTEMLNLAERAERVRKEKRAQLARFEVRLQKIQAGIATAVPDLVEDSLIDYTSLDTYYQHLHHCPDDSPDHIRDVVAEIAKKMHCMARRKALLINAFAQAGLGAPPFESSQLYAYDQKLTAFVQKGTGKITDLVEQRKRELALEKAVHDKKQQKQERETALERALEDKGIKIPAFYAFRFKYYCELYVNGRLEISTEEICQLLQQQEHALHMVSEDKVKDDVAVSITAHLVALHIMIFRERKLSVAALDTEWRLKIGFEYSNKASRRLSDLLRANRDVFTLSEDGFVSLCDKSPESLKRYLLRHDMADKLAREWADIQNRRCRENILYLSDHIIDELKDARNSPVQCNTDGRVAERIEERRRTSSQGLKRSRAAALDEGKPQERSSGPAMKRRADMGPLLVEE